MAVVRFASVHNRMLHAMLAQYKTIHTNYDPVQVLLYCIGHLGGKDLERVLSTLECRELVNSQCSIYSVV